MEIYPNDKRQLRRTYREKRMHLSHESLNELNAGLLSGVKRLEWRGFQTVHLFLPIAGNHEPNTLAIAEWLRSTYPEMRLAISTSNNETREMTPVLWDSNTRLVENRWKIPEPGNGTPIDAREIDALFVPLLIFDKTGNRVGYGKGFYDRFLARCRPDAVKIGLSLFDPVEIISDLNPFDVPLDMCITPTKTWSFPGNQ